MIKIKINASDEIREVTFSRRSEHVIELGGITAAPATGFTTWRMDGVTQLSDYTTVYRTLDNAVQLSDDGSVYVEPEVPDTPVPGETQPTAEEKEKTLIKAQIQALSERNDFLEDCVAEMASIVYA